MLCGKLFMTGAGRIIAERNMARRREERIAFKGSRFGRDAILWGGRWYAAYPISNRRLEEILGERGVEVDPSTLNRSVMKYAPLLDQQSSARECPVGVSWRSDETHVMVKGGGKYFYRAASKAGAVADVLLTAKRDRKAALRFPRQADRSAWRSGEDHD